MSKRPECQDCAFHSTEFWDILVNGKPLGEVNLCGHPRFTQPIPRSRERSRRGWLEVLFREDRCGVEGRYFEAKP